MFHWASTAILCLLALGLYYRHQRHRHVPLMLLAMVLDFMLVIAVELNLHAVEKTFSPEASWMTWLHVGVSANLLGLYIALSILGYKLLRGQANARRWHRTLAVVFVVFRLANYITSYLV